MEVDSGWDDAQSITPSVMGFLASGGKKISDAVTFGPKFCELFHSFCADNELTIDIHRHLFALILEHLIDFVRWVRRDEHQVAEVNNLLFNCDYLRPETRNGVIMVIIYMFASIKSTVLPNADMFSVLVHDEYGLGIANRFSLKIYNDPFCFLAFLKFAVSALIDCGTLPENDRQNTVVKVSKARAEDLVEREFFLKIQRQILAALGENDVSRAKRIVEFIANYCQLNKREIVRGKQFSMCFRKLQTWNADQAETVSTASTNTNTNTAISAPATAAAVVVPALTVPSVADAVDVIAPVHDVANSAIASPRETATLLPPQKRRAAAFADDAHTHTTTHALTAHTTPQTIPLSHMLHTLTHTLTQTQSVQGLRYTRVGRATWTISRFAIFDLCSLLATMRSSAHYNRTLFLVDSNNNNSDNAILQPNTHYSLAPNKYRSNNTNINNQNNNSHSNDSNNNNNNNNNAHIHAHVHALSRSLGIQTLRNAFISAQALVTDWDAEDTQLPLFWALLQSSSSRDLPAIWRSEISPANTTNTVNASAAAVRASDRDRESDRERGFIAIEVDQRMIICIRRVVVHSESSAFPASFSSDGEGEDEEDREETPDSDNNKKKRDNKRRRAAHHTTHPHTNAHKEEELWCHIYAEDLAETDAAQSVGEYLLSLFPQLCTRLSASLFARTIVKYRATPLLESASLPSFHTQTDTRTHTEAMETLGTLSQRVGDLLCKLSPHQVCHNFTLEVL